MSQRSSSLIGTLIIAIAAVLAVWVGGNAIRHRNDGPRTISVKGSAEMRFRSNLGTWQLTIQSHSETPQAGFDEVARQREVVMDFLRKHRFEESEIETLGVSYFEKKNGYFDKNRDRYVEEDDGFIVSQSIVITSGDVDKIDETSKAVGDLISLGVTAQVFAPEYYFTDLAGLKLEMLDAAAADARDRATAIARSSHGRLGELQSSKMGVFQILGAFANENYSWGGTLNTSDIEKTANITVTSTFLLK